MSFGYKTGVMPVSNLTFDVRFIKNPYWEEELRPFSGLDRRIQEYVLCQPTIDFLGLLFPFLNAVIPKLTEKDEKQITIAFGCTGGRHRSVALVEVIAKTLQETFPDATVIRYHRELSRDVAGLQSTASEEKK